jgi:hypothetical protein
MDTEQHYLKSTNASLASVNQSIIIGLQPQAHQSKPKVS